MKVLVVTSEPITAQQLRGTLTSHGDPSDAEVMVVAPALQESGLRFWMSDADKAIAQADEVRREAVDKLGEGGVSASGDTGESDPATAIQDALMTFDADRIVLFTHSGDDQDYLEDIDPDEIRDRFGLPVDRATV
jgi:hypothetical protein